MKRAKKYTHITARCNVTAKRISTWQLKKYCGYTLSEAYWRMEEGKGLMSLYDQESFELWSQIMNGVARIKPLSRLTPNEYKEFQNLRNDVWNNMENYREWLERGEMPLYVRQIAWDEIGCDEYFFYLAVEKVFGKESVIDCNQEQLNSMKRIAGKLAAEFERKQGTLIKEGSSPENFFVPYEGVYQIRADYNHKTSNSELIRFRMDGIWSVADRSSVEDRNIYDHNKAIIQSYIDLKRERSEKNKNPEPRSVENIEFWMNFLRKIQIPEY